MVYFRYLDKYKVVYHRPLNKDFEHIEQYYHLIEEAYTKIDVGIRVFNTNPRRLHNKEELLQTVEDGWILGLLEQDVLVGTITITPHRELEESDSAVVVLHLAAVSPKIWGSGLGLKIVRLAEELILHLNLNQKTKVNLYAVHEHSLEKFYTKCGYAVVSRKEQEQGVWGSCRPFTIVEMSKTLYRSGDTAQKLAN